MCDLKMEHKSGHPFFAILFSHTTGLDERRPNNYPRPATCPRRPRSTTYPSERSLCRLLCRPRRPPQLRVRVTSLDTSAPQLSGRRRHLGFGADPDARLSLESSSLPLCIGAPSRPQSATCLGREATASALASVPAPTPAPARSWSKPFQVLCWRSTILGSASD
jgi:hypothetical protein